MPSSRGAETSAARDSTIVALTDRVRYLHRARLAAAALGVLGVLTGLLPTDDPLRALTPLVLVAIGAQFVVLVGGVSARRWRPAVSGALLLADAMAVVWLLVSTGGTTSHARVLIVLHVVVATLLAAPRSGVKLALWYALLLLLGAEAMDAGLLPMDGSSAGAGALGLQAVAIALLTMQAARASERELSRSRHGLLRLAEFTRNVQEIADPLEVLTTMATEVGDILGSDTVLIIDAGTGRVVVDLDGGTSAGGLVVESELLRTVMEHNRPVTSAQLTAADGWLAARLPSATNLVALPVPANGEVVAFVVAVTPVPAGSRVEQRLLDAVARSVQYGALAHANASLRAALDRAATTDGLTGVANRASLDDRLGRELRRAAIGGSTTALLLIDIDHFKPFNDDFGHQVGDVVLQRVAATLFEGARPTDLVARYGGEEFAIILPDTSLEHAISAAERHRRSVHGVEAPREVTVSIGVAVSGGPASELERLVEAADQALYRAKDRGRDQVMASRVTAAITGHGTRHDGATDDEAETAGVTS